MTTITEKLAEALKALADCREPFNPDKSDDWNPEAYRNARTTMAEYEATPRVYFPADYVREKLEKYDAEIADGTVSYPFYAGVFSQVARGMMERVA